MVDKDMLEAMAQLLSPISDRLDKIDTRLSTVEGDLRTVKDDVQSLKADVVQIPVIKDDVRILLNGMAGMNEKFTKLDQVAEDVEQIKEKVFALEEASKTQASQIRELRMVK